MIAQKKMLHEDTEKNPCIQDAIETNANCIEVDDKIWRDFLHAADPNCEKYTKYQQ